MTWTDDMLCVKSGDILNCNINPNSLWWGSPISIQWTSWSRCTYNCADGGLTTIKRNCWSDSDCSKEQTKWGIGWCSSPTDDESCIKFAEEAQVKNPSRVTINSDGCSIECYAQAPSCEWECTWWGSGIQVRYYSGWKVCRYMTQAAIDNMRAAADFLPPTSIQWSWEIRCIFNDEVWSTSPTSTVEITQTWTAANYCSSVDGRTLHCNNIITFSPTAPTWDWDEFWSFATWWTSFGEGDTSTTIFPINANYKVNIWLTATTPYNLNVNGIVHFHNGSQATAKFAGNSIGFFWAKNFTLQNMRFQNNGGTVQTQLNKTIPWFMVNWAIAAWTQNDYIYMYAWTWSSGTWVGRHYEIMWNNELSVGTKDGAFLYFVEKDQAFTQYINTYAPEPTLVSSSSSTPSNAVTNHNISIEPTTLQYDKIYSSLMVWVNTDNPKATLDVNWSIKVWSNCLKATTICTEDIVWTIIYINAASQSNVWRLVICMDGVNWSHKRHDLISWLDGTTLTDFWYQAYCDIPLASEALPATLLPVMN